MRFSPILLLIVVYATPISASDPGQPLDCSDWVFLEPGLTCSPWVSFPCDDTQNPFCGNSGVPLWAFDNAERVYQTRDALSVRVEGCGGIDRIELVRHDGISQEVVAYLDTRCHVTVGQDAFEYVEHRHIVFDDKGGRFLIPIRNKCFGDCTYANGNSVIAISGFATTFEILQTYEPTLGPISFRVPYMPEGLPAADWFDTYYGDLATVGDWSQAQPLECEYPATMPAVGEYLAVDDPLPNPSPGSGRYYVTAVNYQGQTRYGRKSISGVLSSRDPAVLPGCGE